MSQKYLQGTFTPRNPEKYAGDVTEIRFRSSWEKKLMIFLDNNPNILMWASEEVEIPYYSKVDKRYRRYFPDMIVKYKTKSGEIKKALIEVKPLAQTKPPVAKPNRNKRKYMEEVATYIKNQDKWEAAVAWCNKNGFDFQILTEKELGV